MMNEDLTEVRNHAELVVADLLRRTLNIYENELASPVTKPDSTECDMDSIGDQTLMIERNIPAGNDETGENGKHGKRPSEPSGPENIESVDQCAVTLRLIEKIKADTSKLNNTLKLFNRKHKTLPSIAENGSEGK